MTKPGSPKLPFCLSSQTEWDVYLNEASDEYGSLCAPAKVYDAFVLHGHNVHCRCVCVYMCVCACWRFIFSLPPLLGLFWSSALNDASGKRVSLNLIFLSIHPMFCSLTQVLLMPSSGDLAFGAWKALAVCG